jgi:hypothetical protein
MERIEKSALLDLILAPASIRFAFDFRYLSGRVNGDLHILALSLESKFASSALVCASNSTRPIICFYIGCLLNARGGGGGDTLERTHFVPMNERKRMLIYIRILPLFLSASASRVGVYKNERKTHVAAPLQCTNALTLKRSKAHSAKADSISALMRLLRHYINSSQALARYSIGICIIIRASMTPHQITSSCKIQMIYSYFSH